METQNLTTIVDDPFLTPATLAMHLWPSGNEKWIPGAHLLYASSRIAHAITKGDGRLIVSMPPRHGKSRLISETTIPWFLNRYPGKHVILSSYNADQAEKFGRKARDIIVSRPNLFDVKVRKDVKRVDHFMTKEGSETYFIGMKGGATGKGAHLMIVDDPIKNIEEAMSPTYLDKLWLDFLANLDTRLEPDASVIIVATRWATKDIIGRIISKLEGWEYIEFPAIATEEDVLGRKVGEPLFPERYTLKRLEEIKKARVGTFLWESLYQQRPIDDVAKLTSGDWVQIVPLLGHNHFAALNKARAWDMAATPGGGDYTVGTLTGKEPDSSGGYILNVVRKQLSPANVEKTIREVAELDGTSVDILIEREPGSQGIALIDHYKHNVLPEFNVIDVPAGNKSKVVRAQSMIAAVEYGRFVLQEGPWNEAFVKEFDDFPPGSGGHDDQVDTAAMGYNHLYQDIVKSPAWWLPGSTGTTGYYREQEPFTGLGSSEREIVEAINKERYRGKDPNALVTGAVW